MKNLLFALAFILIHHYAVIGQTSPADETSAHVTHMEVFEPWQGHWQGEGTMNRNGRQQKFHVDEKIAMKLNGSILTIEGIGKDTPDENGKIVHHAFAVLNYDAATSRYQFRTYLADGKNTNAWFEVVDKSKYQWGFDVPSGKIRYTILIDAHAGTWTESGEYSGDGNNWFEFLTMHLKKQ